MIESSLAFGAVPPQQETAFSNWKSAAATISRRHAVMRYDVNDRTAGPMPVFGNLLEKDMVVRNGGHGAAVHALTDPAQDGAADRPDLAYATLPDDDYSFGDVIDMINPLQHLPVVGMLYRKFTGDTIKPFASIIGGAIFGGPVGAVSSTINAIVKDRTGKDIGENALAMVDIDMSPAKTSSKDLVYYAPKEEENSSLNLSFLDTNHSRAQASKKNFSSHAAAAYTASASRPNAQGATQRWNI